MFLNLKIHFHFPLFFVLLELLYKVSIYVGCVIMNAYFSAKKRSSFELFSYWEFQLLQLRLGTKWDEVLGNIDQHF